MRALGRLDSFEVVEAERYLRENVCECLNVNHSLCDMHHVVLKPRVALHSYFLKLEICKG